MKTSLVLVVMAVLLAVLGAGLSYSGYIESVQTLTTTSTRSYTATSTWTTASTSTESIATVTSRSESVLSTTIELEGKGEYCGLYDDANYLSLDAGPLHVSYDSGAKPVDFWLLDEKQLRRWVNTKSCPETTRVPAIVMKIGVSSYEFTTDMSSSGVYYFVFMNRNKESVSIALSVDTPYQAQTTISMERTYYSTQESPYITQTASVSSYPAGFGPLFFSGIGLIVAAGTVLVIIRWKYPGSTPAQIPPESLVVPRVSDVPPPRSGVMTVAEPYLARSAAEHRAENVPESRPMITSAPPLEEQKLLDLLDRLEKSHQNGTVSDSTYQRLREDYEKKLTELRWLKTETRSEKFCVNCGAPLPAHAVFCNKCGSKQ